MTTSLRIGLVGTGFGRRVMLPAFAACEGAQVVAVCSARREHAEAAAREHGVPGVYTDYEAMLAREALDLVAITTPPHLHRPMTEAAAARGIHILCEKPTALNLEEAKAMLEAARQAGVLHLIDHELRFLPTLARMKALIAEGYLGPPQSVTFSIRWSYPLVLRRPWNWWFDAERGGGLLGALGSHQVDLLRWLFDAEVRRVKGVLKVFPDELPLPDSEERRPVTSDTFCAFLAELDVGALGSVHLDATARVFSEESRWTFALHGSAGSLLFDGNGRLWGLQDGEKTELSAPDEVEVPGLTEGVFPRGFAHFSRRIVAALRAGERHVPQAATFHDGVRVQAVLDAVRAADAAGSWLEV